MCEPALFSDAVGGDVEHDGTGKPVGPRLQGQDGGRRCRPVQECPVVELGVAVGVRQGPHIDLDRIGRIAHVEQRDLGARGETFVGGVLADTDDERFRDGVQVGRKTGDLQFAEHTHRSGIADVDDVERVDLSERDHIGLVVDVTDREDSFTLAESADRADRFEAIAVQLHRHDLALGAVAPRRPLGGRNVERAVAIVHRKLVQQVPLDGAGTLVDRRRVVGDREAVDCRFVVLAEPLFAGLVDNRIPHVGRHVQTVLRGIDGVARRHHGARADRCAEGSSEADRHDRQHVESGEVGR